MSSPGPATPTPATYRRAQLRNSFEEFVHGADLRRAKWVEASFSLNNLINEDAPDVDPEEKMEWIRGARDVIKRVERDVLIPLTNHRMRTMDLEAIEEVFLPEGRELVDGDRKLFQEVCLMIGMMKAGLDNVSSKKKAVEKKIWDLL